ncbi:hypothetical protein TSUD_386820 [Trifolium subterraneum]|uniref:Uncharacterized protein n=1 Tax=Trifolium subterraneum TaxID=3900 RepID=A0A2Z6P5A7_TRISU|nr:hypothetical protein TSUD_386820 [Trifolium subterraneum]
MGLIGIQENGNGNGDLVSEIPLGTKTKYIRMISDDSTEEQELGFSTNKHDAKKYIFACAIFASLNSVLLGYGR